MAPECQSFLDNVVAQDQGNSIAELPRWNHSRENGSIATACLARSSSPLSPTTHSRSNGDFPNRRQRPAIGGPSFRRLVSATANFALRRVFRVCLCAEIPVSQETETGSAETRFDMALVQGSRLKAEPQSNVITQAIERQRLDRSSVPSAGRARQRGKSAETGRHSLS
jgi:hypothetical protein